MRMIPFEKYEGAGNDFIIVDFFDHGEFFDLNDQILIEKMCDRRFGIGADGMIALCKNDNYDFEMKYLNSDGRFSTFCGNGSRCISMYASRKWNRNQFKFLAADGEHESIIHELGSVSVRMKEILEYKNTEVGPFVDSGSPHLIHYVEDAFNYEVDLEGRRMRNQFSKEGANVNFISNVSDRQIKIATYERGVEAETLACGTGITAAAYYHAVSKGMQGNQIIQVKAKGGELEVSMRLNEREARDLWLTGPARRVYSGFWYLSESK